MEHISHTCFEALQKGEEQACSITFRHYQGFARHVAYRCGVDPVTADDVIQMAFLKLYAHSAKLDSPSSIAQWLAVSIRNLCLDEFRKNSRTQRKTGAYAEHQKGTLSKPSILKERASRKLLGKIVKPQERSLRGCHACARN
jgi:RNA polymerase sigma factor (sigma-70 family)